MSKTHPTEPATELFLNGHNCAQAIVAAFCPSQGLSADEGYRLASGLGGGLSGTRQTCGALVGALIILGLDSGTFPPGDLAAKKAQYARGQSLIDSFTATWNTSLCGELLAALDLQASTTPSARTDEYYNTRPCTRTVAHVAELLSAELHPSDES